MNSENSLMGIRTYGNGFTQNKHNLIEENDRRQSYFHKCYIQLYKVTSNRLLSFKNKIASKMYHDILYYSTSTTNRN